MRIMGCMIGRWLTPEEIQWVFGQSERLTANGYPPTVEACLRDYAFASVDSNWQGTFVGVFLVAAVYLGKIRAKRG